MKIERLYFKWNKNLDSGKYQLDELLSPRRIESELVKESKDNSNYKIKSDQNVYLKIDSEGKIESMFFTKNSRIGNFEISWEFIRNVKEKFELHLEVCEKDYLGDKLILHFGDAFLHAASLVRKRKN